MPAALQEISSLGGSSPVFTYLINVASETVDFVQSMGAGIRGLGGSLDLELVPVFPFFAFASLGTRCASFFPMAQLEELQQENESRSIKSTAMLVFYPRYEQFWMR